LGKKEHIHKKLIESCKKGNERSKYELYQLYAKAMFNVCYRILNNREEAEDMLQEAFTQAFLKLDTFRHESGFGTWLKRIVVNKCINAINKKRIELDYLEENYKKDVPIEEDEIEVEYSVDTVKKVMLDLPEGGRVIFSLYLLEGYDHFEISQILNISESTSKSQFMRAKRRIIEILKDKKTNTYEA
jgi:RNA polymerase sigma-70 factor (ECF subfamily)